MVDVVVDDGVVVVDVVAGAPALGAPALDVRPCSPVTKFQRTLAAVLTRSALAVAAPGQAGIVPPGMVTTQGGEKL